MTYKEKLFNVAIFEIIAIAIVVPVIVYSTGNQYSTALLSSLSFSLIVITWNFIFNNIFDSICKIPRIERKLGVRIIHTLFFQLGLVVVAIPVLSFSLSITLTEAFFLELGFLCFFFFYNMLFHYSYDKFQPYDKIFSKYR